MTTLRARVLTLLAKYKYLLAMMIMLAGNVVAFQSPIWLIPRWVEYTPIVYIAISFAWLIPFGVCLWKKLIPLSFMSLTALCLSVIFSVWIIANMLYWPGDIGMAYVSSENCTHELRRNGQIRYGCVTAAEPMLYCKILFEAREGVPFMRYVSAYCLF